MSLGTFNTFQCSIYNECLTPLQLKYYFSFNMSDIVNSTLKNKATNTYDATITGATITSGGGKFGFSCMNFTSSSYLELLSIPLQKFQNGMTISYWINIPSIASTYNFSRYVYIYRK